MKRKKQEEKERQLVQEEQKKLFQEKTIQKQEEARKRKDEKRKKEELALSQAKEHARLMVLNMIRIFWVFANQNEHECVKIGKIGHKTIKL